MKQHIIIVMCVLYTLFTSCTNTTYNTDETAHAISTTDHDAFVLLQPYTRIDKASQELKIDLTKVESTGIERRDDINVLCLLQYGKLQAFYALPRDKFNVDSLRSDTMLQVKKGQLGLIKNDSVYHLKYVH
jgi:hypothetical protein